MLLKLRVKLLVVLLLDPYASYYILYYNISCRNGGVTAYSKSYSSLFSSPSGIPFSSSTAIVTFFLFIVYSFAVF